MLPIAVERRAAPNRDLAAGAEDACRPEAACRDRRLSSRLVCAKYWRRETCFVFGLFKKRPPPPPAPPAEDAADPLCLVFIPALVTVLLNVERTMGRPLTEAEVIAIRDKAVCMAMPASKAAMMEAKRGYPDVAAEAVWPKWQSARLQLGQT
jgi:hypothetical protein